MVGRTILKTVGKSGAKVIFCGKSGMGDAIILTDEDIGGNKKAKGFENLHNYLFELDVCCVAHSFRLYLLH